MKLAITNVDRPFEKSGNKKCNQLLSKVLNFYEKKISVCETVRWDADNLHLTKNVDDPWKEIDYMDRMKFVADWGYFTSPQKTTMSQKRYSLTHIAVGRSHWVNLAMWLT